MSYSVEQFCRDILEKAIAEGLVMLDEINFPFNNPQEFSGGDLCGLANFVNDNLDKVNGERIENDSSKDGKPPSLIPEGFRMLNGSEYVRTGDAAWNGRTEIFESVFNINSDRLKASSFICVIRKVENV